jgi:hypothetical protein
VKSHKYLEAMPQCIYCEVPTNHSCRVYGEPICLECADERDLFDGEDIISEDARDEFFARCMRDAREEAR